MKKNLISVLILALVFANFVLTAILMFTVLPQTKKANTLIDKVCSAIDLDLNSGGAGSGMNSIPIDKQESYKVNAGEDIITNLAASEGDKDKHYAVVKLSLVLNTESENYKTYTQEFLTGQDDTIKNKINTIIAGYTMDEFNANNHEDVKQVILEEMQKMFGVDYVIDINFASVQTE